MQWHRNKDFSVLCCICFSVCERWVLNQSFISCGGWRLSKHSHTPFMQICKQQLMGNVRKGKHHFYSLSSSSSVFGNAWMGKKPQKGLRTGWIVLTHAGERQCLNLQKAKNASSTWEELRPPLLLLLCDNSHLFPGEVNGQQLEFIKLIATKFDVCLIVYLL